ncbi:MAG: hypothetical protein V7731_00930 [Amphritea sp.]
MLQEAMDGGAARTWMYLSSKRMDAQKLGLSRDGYSLTRTGLQEAMDGGAAITWMYLPSERMDAQKLGFSSKDAPAQDLLPVSFSHG